LNNSTAKAPFDDKDLHASFRTPENSRQSYTFHDKDRHVPFLAGESEPAGATGTKVDGGQLTQHQGRRLARNTTCSLHRNLRRPGPPWPAPIDAFQEHRMLRTVDRQGAIIRGSGAFQPSTQPGAKDMAEAVARRLRGGSAIVHDASA
jgi:hypothetical protein